MEISLIRGAHGAISLQHEVFGKSPALEGKSRRGLGQNEHDEKKQELKSICENQDLRI
jgi:hypothetical protein